MKTRIFSIAILALIAVLFFASCEKDNMNTEEDNSILPERFKVDIPNSLSNTLKSTTLKSANEVDTLDGDQIYRHLNTFIAVGEAAADIVQEVIWSIKLYKIEQVIELTFVSDEDGRVKHLVVEADVEFDGRRWEYMLTLTDLESEGNPDGGIGLQVFWNKRPIEGIAIIKPYNLNHNENRLNQAMYSIEYSERGLGEYEKYMIVAIADVPVADVIFHRFDMNALKMFVGQKGDVVDVYGNSNHPYARFFTDRCGFNWAFVASGNKTEDIAVAEVGLPPSLLDATSREVLLKEYSIKNVLTQEINDWFIEKFGIKPDSTDLAAYLGDADAPGYFDANGFIQGGTAPSDEYAEYERRIESLTPYNPKSINELEIVFKQ